MAEDDVQLPGRFIEDVPFTGLVDSLAKMTVLAEGIRTLDHDANARTELLAALDEVIQHAVIFSTAQPEEWKAALEKVRSAFQIIGKPPE